MPVDHDISSNTEHPPCDMAKTCTKWFTEHKVQLLSWPGNSPDLNTIEDSWSELKKLVTDKHPSKKQQLVEAITMSLLRTSEELVKTYKPLILHTTSFFC